MSERMATWTPIREADIRVGRHYDIWVKAWNDDDDTFRRRRVTNVPFRGGALPTGNANCWLGLDPGWFVTHVMDIPEAPQ